VPVVVERLLAVIECSDLLRPEDLLLGSVINPVLDILFVQLAEAEDGLMAAVITVKTAVSAIGARSDKAVGYSTGRIDVVIAGATPAALTLGATIPVALHAAHTAVGRIEWQTDVDGDVLRRRTVCGGAAIAQHHQTISDGDGRRRGVR